MMKISIAAAGLLALAACGGSGSKESGGNAAGAEATKGGQKSAAAPSGGGGSGGEALALTPGQYEVTTEVMGQKNVASACITEKDLKETKGAPLASDPSKNCTYEDVKTSGGKFSGTMSCSEDGQSMKMVMDGTHTRDSYDMSVKAELPGMSITTRIKAKRVGECSAADAG